MQYIAIKEEQKAGKTVFIVNAIPLKNSAKALVQKIPHPLGSDSLTFETLELAKEAVTRAGFSYILPDGKKGTTTRHKTQIGKDSKNYEQIIISVIKDKTDSSNSTVAAAAVSALSVFPNEETFDILFNKIGEDNDLIRKNAISGICRYGTLLQDRIIDSLKSSNWVVRNSAISCINQLAETSDIDLEKFIIPLAKTCDDSNSIVQTNAIATLAKVYQNFQKNKKV